MSSLLWQIENNGIYSYLYGTIHIRDKRVFGFDNIVYDKLLECNALGLESIPDEIPLDLLGEIFTMNDTSLSSLLSEETYNLLEEVLSKKYNMSISSFEYTKPMFIANEILMQNDTQEMSAAVDLHLLKIARENSKEILALETYEEQFEAVVSFPLDEQVKMLEDVLKEQNINDKYEEIIEAYTNSDLDKIAELTTKNYSRAFKNSFLTKRNKKMTERIVEYSSTNSCFFGFGAGHLPGKDGVINQLKIKGVNPIPIRLSFNL